MTSTQNDAIMVLMSPEDASRVGTAGEVLASNIKRVRTAQRLSFAELSRMLTDIGRPIPELGLRRIELGTRRVDFDDLLAISYALKVAPVDLMVSKDAKDDDPYPLIPRREFTATSVREWIRGADVMLGAVQGPDSIFADPDKSMSDALSWMPTERRKEVTRRWLNLESEEDLQS
jgi:transcriptional regulator with XRE-family HTH domain